MGIREMLTSIRSAADEVSRTAEYVREGYPNPLMVESAYQEVKTAAQRATITLAIVGLVASLALVMASYTLARD